MTDQQPPDIAGIVLPWTPESHWQPGDFEPRALLRALAAQTALVDYTDDVGNAQSRVRLDPDPAGATGYWITVPAGTDPAVIAAGVAAYVAPADPAAPEADPQT